MWDLVEFGGIKDINVNLKIVWKFDIFFYNK